MCQQQQQTTTEAYKGKAVVVYEKSFTKSPLLGLLHDSIRENRDNEIEQHLIQAQQQLSTNEAF